MVLNLKQALSVGRIVAQSRLSALILYTFILAVVVGKIFTLHICRLITNSNGSEVILHCLSRTHSERDALSVYTRNFRFF
jgi:hypothetical protein